MKQFFALALLVLAACETSSVGVEEGAILPGTWLLYETGYSPGAGYIVESVAPKPPQTMTFQAGRRFISNINGLEAFSFYRLFDDPMGSGEVLALYKKEPGSSPTLESSAASYNLEHNGSTIKLYFRFCIEGCHLALRKI